MDEKPSNEHPMTSLILAVLGILAALGGLITVLSSSLIINTLNALLTQQLHQIGIMKLVGARSQQIMGMYVTLIVAYSVIALLLAVPLGAIAGYAMASFIANLIGAVLQGFRIIPLAVVIQTVIAIAVPLGAGFFPVSAGARTSVQQAISNYRPGSQAGKAELSQPPSQLVQLDLTSHPSFISQHISKTRTAALHHIYSHGRRSRFHCRIQCARFIEHGDRSGDAALHGRCDDRLSPPLQG